MKERNSATRAMAQRSGGGAPAERPEHYKGGGTCTACTDDKCQCDVDALLGIDASSIYLRERAVRCPVCKCENAPLGYLGLRAQYNCRACGFDYSTNEQGWIA